MKKRLLNLLTGLAVCGLAVCGLAACGAERGAEAGGAASFAVFLRNFTANADYQLAHIRFPLADRISGVVTADNRPVPFGEELWALKELAYFEVDPQSEYGGFTQESPEEIRFERGGNEIGYYATYTFRLIDGAWYLVAGDESGSDLGSYEYALAEVRDANGVFRRKYADPGFEPYASTAACEGEWPEGSTRELTPADLEGRDAAELRLMRNEIFARRGYVVESADLKRRFLKEKWEAPLFGDVSAALSDVEKRNIELLSAAEKARR